MSPIPEIATLARISAVYLRTTTGKNLHNLMMETGLDLNCDSTAAIKAALDINEVPEVDKWRLPLLSRLVDDRMELETMGEDTTNVEELITSLCSS